MIRAASNGLLIAVERCVAPCCGYHATGIWGVIAAYIRYCLFSIVCFYCLFLILFVSIIVFSIIVFFHYIIIIIFYYCLFPLLLVSTGYPCEWVSCVGYAPSAWDPRSLQSMLDDPFYFWAN